MNKGLYTIQLSRAITEFYKKTWLFDVMFIVFLIPKLLHFAKGSLQPGCGKKGPGHTRIVGGQAAKPGDWPWIVTFDYEFNTANPGHHCGGTLLTDEWILSAAHCFYDDKDKSRYTLTLGKIAKETFIKQFLHDLDD